MSRRTFTRIAAAGASAALIATGMSVAMGTGVASAYDAETCATSAQRSYDNFGSFGTDYYLSKEILNDGVVAPDGTVTFLIKSWGAGALISELRDFHPEGFELEKAEINVSWVLGGQGWEDATARAVESGNRVSVRGAGWTTAGGATAALRTTYRAPSDLEPGTKVDAGGAGFNVVLAGGDHDWTDLNLCATVRAKNAGEQVSGSLDNAGLGSVNTASANAFGSLTDPQGSIAGIINNLDFGKIIGGAMGS
ncbi:hypothetical protein [Tomitella fengzijianii]|uniref:Uncharacterized protein n=1 Tax=Tomitella fengzijianii TaxID=2597660 RepID=A0A516X4W6_9ACTN|nr:hypothetical protein [Tomitella fengzijianii]QDQ98090.1 hypothetical protein FO059_13175 [Tomitella fengzijianii]